MVPFRSPVKLRSNPSFNRTVLKAALARVHRPGHLAPAARFPAPRAAGKRER